MCINIRLACSCCIHRLACNDVHYIMHMEDYVVLLFHVSAMSVSSLHNVDDFLQLVRSRYLPQGTPENISTAERNPSTSISTSNVKRFNFYLLQEDVMTTYLIGKPLLESAGSIRTHFKFRSAQPSSPHPTE